MFYNPGTHLIATLHTIDTNLLHQYNSFKNCVDDPVRLHQLQKLGDLYHNFSPTGYTGVVCLSESHLSVHTWPEHGRVNIDIYLSNYLRDNDGTVQAVYRALLEHFGATVVTEQIIKR